MSAFKLAVYSGKVCWRDEAAGGYRTDGGFPFQMRAISELFSETRLVVPVQPGGAPAGTQALSGRGLSVVELSAPGGRGLWRKLMLPAWMARHARTLMREFRRADAIHAPIPGDVGTLALVAALAARKPLLVRHCGNWSARRTMTHRFWRWVMERYAGQRNVMLATGGAAEPPSARNRSIEWIFSTALTSQEMDAWWRARSAPSKPPRLATASRQERGKGTEVAIAALGRLAQHPACAGITLDVVGEGSYLAELKRIAAERGVADRVRFHGRRSHGELMRLLSEADLFCYPTETEGFPKVVLEALACGLPVVTTRVSVLPLIVGGGAGILLDGATAESVAGAVLECLGERYGAMSAAAIAAAREYTLERWRDTLGAILRRSWGEHAVNC